MSDIPEAVRAEARRAIYDTGRGMIGRERNYLEDRVCRALLAAEKRGKEEAAKIAANLSPDDVTDDSHTNGWTLGFLWARKCIAAAIRGS